MEPVAAPQACTGGPPAPAPAPAPGGAPAQGYPPRPPPAPGRPAGGALPLYRLLARHPFRRHLTPEGGLEVQEVGKEVAKVVAEVPKGRLEVLEERVERLEREAEVSNRINIAILLTSSPPHLLTSSPPHPQVRDGTISRLLKLLLAQLTKLSAVNPPPCTPGPGPGGRRAGCRCPRAAPPPPSSSSTCKHFQSHESIFCRFSIANVVSLISFHVRFLLYLIAADLE